jgi:hypothetical protein
MMRLSVSLLLCALLTGACGSSTQPQPTIAPTPASGNGVHTLILEGGKVMVKRNGWTRSSPGRFGMLLRSGDLLEISDSVKGLVVCADLSIGQLAAGFGGVPCPEAPPQIYVEDSRVMPARSGQQSTPLQLVSPRSTRLLSIRPTIRWSAPPELDMFTVTVNGPGVMWSMTTSNTTSLAYPADQPALRPGKEYLIEVKSGDQSTEDERDDGRGFTLLVGAERMSAEAAITHVTGLKLDQAATRIVMTRILLSKQLYADAFDQLLALPDAQTELEVLLLKGDIYLATGLARLAEEQYAAARAQAVIQADLEAQARAELMLGRVYQEALGNPDEAKKQLQDAQEHYRTLGDQAGSATAEQLLHPQSTPPTK